jgi:diacylglycerol kinase family enzyme
LKKNQLEEENGVSSASSADSWWPHAIVPVGGDGTVHEVLNGLADVSGKKIIAVHVQ